MGELPEKSNPTIPSSPIENQIASTTLRYLVPSNLVRLVVGKKGTTIKGLMSESGSTKMSFNGEIENDKKVLIIEGTPENVKKGEKAVSDFIENIPPDDNIEKRAKTEVSKATASSKTGMEENRNVVANK